MIDLTDRQRQVLEWVIWYVDTYGYPPSFREIGGRMGINSTNGVKDHLLALQRNGYVRVDPDTSRGIQVLRFPEGVAAQVAVLPRQLVEEYRRQEGNGE